MMSLTSSSTDWRTVSGAVVRPGGVGAEHGVRGGGGSCWRRHSRSCGRCGGGGCETSSSDPVHRRRPFLLDRRWTPRRRRGDAQSDQQTQQLFHPNRLIRHSLRQPSHQLLQLFALLRVQQLDPAFAFERVQEGRDESEWSGSMGCFCCRRRIWSRVERVRGEERRSRLRGGRGGGGFERVEQAVELVEQLDLTAAMLLSPPLILNQRTSLRGGERPHRDERGLSGGRRGDRERERERRTNRSRGCVG